MGLGVAAEAFEVDIGHFARDGILVNAEEEEAVGGLLVAHEGVAVFAEAGDAAVVGTADVPLRERLLLEFHGALREGKGGQQKEKAEEGKGLHR